MKKLITPVLFLFCASAIVAQTTTDDYYHPLKSKFLAKDKVSASVSMGAGLSFLGSNKNTAFTTFIAPKIGYQFTNKFKLNFGLMHYSISGNTFMPLNQNEALINRNNNSVSGNLLFAEGQYQLNKKLIMSGAVMYDASKFAKNNNFKAASLGLDYKLSNRSTIGFRATVSQGSTDYYLNPRSNSFEYSPYTNPLQNAMFGVGSWGTSQLNSAIR